MQRSFPRAWLPFSALREQGCAGEGETTSFFGIGFHDGTMFLSKRTPRQSMTLTTKNLEWLRYRSVHT